MPDAESARQGGHGVAVEDLLYQSGAFVDVQKRTVADHDSGALLATMLLSEEAGVNSFGSRIDAIDRHDAAGFLWGIR